MKAINKIYTAIIAVAIIIICIAFIRACNWISGDKTVSKTETVVKTTPVNLDSIKRIGQWSLVTVELDQIVDTVDKGFFRDHDIEVMYHGTLHYGIDMSKLQDDWVKIINDSIAEITLPEAQLLDQHFLDERNVKVILGDDDQKFINRPEVRSALVGKAKAEMIKKGNAHKAEAQQKAEAEISRLFASHGYIVKIKK